MKPFLEKDFLLNTATARELYHDVASGLPIIDYHCHLAPDQIAGNINFQNLTQAWLHGDHYKWRAMRTNGIDESYCTGTRPDEEKFEAWAATVPYTLRNPLYHWTHLELQRYFSIHELLNERTAKKIYAECNMLLQQPEFSVRALLQRMRVEVVCTTDDPADSLEHHRKIKDDNFAVKVLPTFRPDKAMQVSDAVTFNKYLGKLEAASGIEITTYEHFLEAMQQRHDFFDVMGCVSSDHGLDTLYADEYTDGEVQHTFHRLREGYDVNGQEQSKLKSAMLENFAAWNYAKGWVQQYHIGAMRNNNSNMMERLGADTGWDSIGDARHASRLAKLLNKLNTRGTLPKTILYNLNPADNAVFAAMTGNFNEGGSVAPMQYGAAWWFLDQKDGIIHQLNALSSVGLLSRFVGMVTDSRSFFSYPRHEYFRRILCNLFGDEMEAGEMPHDMPWISKIIADICYHNARAYFKW